MTNDEILLTEKQLADRWSVCRQSLANMRSQGRGPRHVKIGRKMVRYRLSDILAFERVVQPETAKLSRPTLATEGCTR